MAQPHILFVDDYPHPNIGGGELHLLRVARGCRDWGYRVGIVCVPGSGLETNARGEGFDVHPLRIGRRRPASRLRLRRLFAQVKPDIVHVHGFNATLTACPAARRAGVGVILTTVHNMPSAPLELRPGIGGRLEFDLRAALYPRVADNVDRFVCVVGAARDELVSLGLDASKLVVIANGIPNPAANRAQVARRDDGTVVVGSVGRLEPLKGYEFFVAAAAIVSSQSPSVRFRLVGDGRLRSSLTAQVASLELGSRFEFAGWSNDATGEISAMDVYVVSSVTDTTNLTILEAMALGKPVVATDVGGISDAVADGDNGYLVPPRRPDLLAERIIRLVEDDALRDRMGTDGRKRYEASFTEERMLEQHRMLYEQMYRAD
ncbi:MAG: glycosyltransferase [Actinomycetota bacterium]|nr:MAG: group 1 glycosyl [Actinomycetota bacterium]MDO8950814.1 glycosyltransferase [Actinomycetota bacterium]MDP3629930.1 glycosyltransferase [Actinomycetota bacterium]